MFTIDPRQELLQLGKAYRRMDEILRWEERLLYQQVEDVSLWSAVQHVEHVARVNVVCFRSVLKLLQDDPNDPEILRRGGPRLMGFLVLYMKHIPRGKAKAPEQFFAPPDVLADAARRTLAESRKGMSAIAEKSHHLATTTGRFAHPILGNFTARQWLRFIRVHTNHHLRIIDDIEARQKKGV